MYCYLQIWNHYRSCQYIRIFPLYISFQNKISCWISVRNARMLIRSLPAPPLSIPLLMHTKIKSTYLLLKLHLSITLHWNPCSLQFNTYFESFSNLNMSLFLKNKYLHRWLGEITILLLRVIRGCHAIG